MAKNHYSDCTLNDLPAYFPGWCTCGGVKDDKQSDRSWYRLDCILVEFAENFVQLWKARIFWKHETGATISRFLLEVAKHLASNRRRRHIQANVSRRATENFCNKN